MRKWTPNITEIQREKEHRLWINHMARECAYKKIAMKFESIAKIFAQQCYNN